MKVSNGQVLATFVDRSSVATKWSHKSSVNVNKHHALSHKKAEWVISVMMRLFDLSTKG